MHTSKKSKIAFYLVVIFAVSLPYSIPISNFALGGTLLALLYSWWPGPVRKKNLLQQMGLILFAGFFILHITGLLYSEDINSGMFSIEKKLAILLLPLVFTCTQPIYNEKEQKQILYAFLSGITLASLFILGIASWRSVADQGFDTDLFFRTETINYIQLHPSYFTIYGSFAILIAFSFFNKGSHQEKLFLSISILINLILMFFMAARMPLLAFFVSAIFLGILSLQSRKSFLILSGCILLFGIMATLAYQNSPAMQRRFKEISETKLDPPMGIHHNSTNLRVAQLLCTGEILSENWLWGVGTGDSQNELNSCYRSKGWSEVLYLKSFNAHNQFLETWLALGLPGLFFLSAIFIYGLYSAIRNKEYLFASFIILVGLCCLTESILEKNKGIFFFTFFYIYFISGRNTKSAQNKAQEQISEKLPATEDQSL